jgi:alkanesulfonate monooxygenase
MQLGVGLPSFASPSHAIPPDRFRRYVQRADEYEFAGAWLIEHLVEPPTYETSQLDPLTTLSHVTGQTETLPVGTSVLLLPLRNPVLLAKRAATLQHLSSRRLTLGMGTGYVEAEFDAVGVPREERSPRYLEAIELLGRLFEEETVTFDGEYHSLEEFTLEPALGQPPRMLAGGGGVDTDDGRIVLDTVKERFRHADGWIAAPRTPETLERDWELIADYLDGEGLDARSHDKVLLQYLHLVPDDDPDRARATQRKIYEQTAGSDYLVDPLDNWLSGTVDEVLATLEAYESLGFEEVILHPMARVPGELDRQLRLYEELLVPQFP